MGVRTIFSQSSSMRPFIWRQRQARPANDQCCLPIDRPFATLLLLLLINAEIVAAINGCGNRLLIIGFAAAAAVLSVSLTINSDNTKVVTLLTL